MSVLSRQHRQTATTDRSAQVPSQRAAAPAADDLSLDTAVRPHPQRQPQLQPEPDVRRSTGILVLAGIAAAAAIGVGTYAVLDDDGGASVVAPGPADAGSTISDADRLSEAQRDAAWARRGAS